MAFKKYFKIILSLMLSIYLPLTTITPAFAEAEETVHVQGELIQEGQFPKKSDKSLKLKSDKLKASTNSQLETTIINGLKAKKESINISSYKISHENISAIYYGIINNHPELFYVSSGIGYSYGSNGYVTEISPGYYDYSDSDITLFNSKAAKVLNLVEDGWTDFQKVLFIHDYMATHCEYDQTYSKYNAYNNIVEGSSVCQGYALAFKYYMNELSIPCEMITSDAGNHAWNAVKVDGNYYYIDVTHDDPLLYTPDVNYCRHDFFLLTTEEMQSTNSAHATADWVKGDQSDAYNTIVTGPSRLNGDTSFIYQAENAIIQNGSNLYYSAISNKTTTLKKYDVSTKKSSTLYSFTDTWYAEGGSYFTSAFSTTLYLEPYFYINGAKKIYRIDLNGNAKVIYELTKAQSKLGSIYFMSLENGVLTYSVCFNPYSDDEIHSYEYVISTNVTAIQAADIVIKEGQTQNLDVTFVPAGSSAELTYSSSNPDIVTVEDGMIKGINHGEAVITISTDNDISTTCKVTVEHDYDEGIVTTAPDCETQGVKTYTCRSCGSEKTESIDAIGHNYDEGVVTTAPTCENEGIKTYTCLNCGKTVEESIAPIGHNYDNGVITREPTCIKDGLKVYTCQNDPSHTLEETLKALGHDYQKVSENAHEIVYQCTRCDDHYTVEVENDDIDINTNIDSSSVIGNIEVNDNAKDSISSALLDRIDEALENENPDTSSEAIKAAVEAGHSLHAELTINTVPDASTQTILDKIDQNESEVIAYVSANICIVDGEKVLGEISSVSLLGLTIELKDYNPDLTYRIVTIVDGKVIDTGAIVDDNGIVRVDVSELTPVVILHDHSYTDEITLLATPTTDGKVYHECTCGYSYTSIIPAASQIENVEVVYTGKTLSPKVTVKDADGQTISSDYYTLSCSKAIKNVGKYTIIVTFNGLYDGTTSTTMTVNPYPTTISKLTKKKKAFKATWKKKSSQVTGYQLQYSLYSDFSSAKTVKIKKYKTTSKTVSKLKAKKTYYVRVRTYKTVSGKTYYSTWSPSKSVKTK